MKAILTVFVLCLGALALGPVSAPTAAYTFVTHAAFFSAESHQPVPIDPQVFVRKAGAPAAQGPQGIIHLPNFVPAPIAAATSTPLYTAAGKLLPVSAGDWFGATGTAQVRAAQSGRPLIRLEFHGLVPGGAYSVFENHFAAGAVTFTPLDGTGRSNSFTAQKDGAADVVIMVRGPFPHANGILLVYHSDGKDHGVERGMPGIDAHHQLILRFP